MPAPKFHDIFPRKKVLLPVLHVNGIGQGIKNANIAVNEGVAGIFLITHTCRAITLLDLYRELRLLHPKLWIGMNFLDLGPAGAIKTLPQGANGLWMDTIGVNDNDKTDPTKTAEQLSLVRRDCYSANALLFGGVDFKYQSPAKDPGYAAFLSRPYLDVVTTSGSATGSPPTLDKIKKMREAIGDFPLAIASGITAQNVERYLPYVDAFLVASSINQARSDDFDPKLLGELQRVFLLQD